uniref:Uncharacterized protein n=1 Tax=Romanomermis culicivorax TaxID=13658 RepID=A0A915J6D1_ROMCU
MRSKICIIITLINLAACRFNENPVNLLSSKINTSQHQQHQQQKFKITIVIDPGAGENYNTLKVEVERTFETEYEISKSRTIGGNAELYNVLIETVNAARVEESPIALEDIFIVLQIEVASLRCFSDQKYGVPMTTVWLAIGLENLGEGFAECLVILFYPNLASVPTWRLS